MLFLQMKSGEYLTIGENITVQVFHGGGTYVRVGINAPKDVAILRGAVRERNGAERPEGLVDPPVKSKFSPGFREPVEIE